MKTSNPFVEIIKSSGKNENFASELAQSLKPRENREYQLQVTCEEDYQDIDAMLSALKIFPNILEKYPDFNNWDANPLITVNAEHVEMLRINHPLSAPRWLKQVCDIRVTPGFFSFSPESNRKIEATIRIGFLDQTLHVLLLSIASRFKLTARIIIRSLTKIDILIFAAYNNRIIPILFADSDLHGNETYLKNFRENSKKSPVIIKIPTTMESYRLFFDSTSGGMSIIDVDAYHSISAKVESKFGAAQKPKPQNDKQWQNIFADV